MLRHRTFGTPIDETVQAFPNELQVDAVGLWQIVNSLRRGFDLENVELGKYIRKSVEALLAAGAVPVIGSTQDTGWRRARDFQGNDKEIVDQLLSYLQLLGRDPDVGDIWFALPNFIDGTH
jgi:hypothetical protein